MSAYDKCYLDEMLQKHRYLFKLIGRNRTDAFKVIADYMNSGYRKNMDQGNPLFLKYNVPSGELVKKLGPEELYSKYYPLHEASVENGSEKLRNIYLN